jgi:hypothetical protein
VEETAYIEELRDLYSLRNIIRMSKSLNMRCAGHVAQMGEKRTVYRILVEKPEGKRSLGKPRRRLVRMGWCRLDWSG